MPTVGCMALTMMGCTTVAIKPLPMEKAKRNEFKLVRSS